MITRLISCSKNVCGQIHHGKLQKKKAMSNTNCTFVTVISIMNTQLWWYHTAISIPYENISLLIHTSAFSLRHTMIYMYIFIIYHCWLCSPVCLDLRVNVTVKIPQLAITNQYECNRPGMGRTFMRTLLLIIIAIMWQTVWFNTITKGVRSHLWYTSFVNMTMLSTK